MNRKYYFIGSAILAALLLVFFVFRSCSPRKIEIDPGFSEYIAGFTSGTISVQSNIRIELTKEVEAVEVNSEVDKKVFSFSPGVSGKAFWIDNRTIEFRPEKSFKQGTRYIVDFYLNKIVKVPKKFKVFEFDFVTMKQGVSLQVEGYQPYVLTSLKWNNATGTLITADVAEDADVERVLKATQDKRKLNISWTHNPESKTHHFKVDSITRGEDASKVDLKWDGSPIGADNSGKEEVKIPSIYDFSVLEANIEQEPNQYVAVRFSDPIDPKQDMTGLITLGNTSDLTFEVDHMVIKVFPSARQNGTVTLNVEQGIKNIAGAKLKKRQTFDLVFESIKPSIKAVGKGVILPDSKGLIFPFEAVNLKAVDVRIIKIFENNVTQFLQVNQLDGTSELKRAGRLILKKTIRLDSEKPIVFNKRNLFSIDLAKLIKQEPGAIYRVKLSFKKEYSTFPCSDKGEEESKDNMTTIQDADQEDAEGDVAYWDAPDRGYNEDYYDYYGESYDWSQREDPCSASYYYGSNVSISRNVLASNLGIIAKGTSDNSLMIAVANLVTTKPMGGVELEVYDYQRQKMASGKTDNDGFCNISLKSKPFLIIAKDGDQRGYLRVDDGTALSLSNFDVSGEAIQKGLKGYIYGERGVWRPGDTVFLTFVLEDKLKKLPANHPVVLEVMNPQGKLFKRIIKTNGVNGFYQFAFSTNASDVTGNWQAYIKIGGTIFSKTLKIETIKPNRLKILFDFGTELLKGSSKATLTAKWLHGAPAKDMRANVAVTLSSANTSFKGYDNYEFDDPAKKYHTDEETIFDKDLDENGNAEVKADFSVNHNAPGMLRANFVTRVFEPGGDFSIDRFNVLYSPYTSYVGVKAPEDQFGYLFTDTSQVFEVATLSPDGKPLNRKNLDFCIYKMEWRWWWDSNSESELANFIGSTYTHPVFSKKVSTTNGKVKVNYRLSYPDWGRFYVRVTDPESGHSTGKIIYFDWPGWRGRADRGDSKGATMLSFSADKKTYKVGDKATITVPSSAGGRMLVSIETGSEIAKIWWVETTAKETKASFEITEKMAPNIFIHVSLIQPHAQTENDLPIRMYGVIPALVENPATHLTPVINMPDVLEPEKPFTVKVSEKNNHSMTYTLAIVDEGLLDLTRFKTPDPWTAFYGREALGVKTWDLYDLVMGAFGGKIESLFAIGGDGEKKSGDGQKANRFKPIVKVLGPFSLKSGNNKHEIILPQYVGSVRVMVVAGDDAAFGKEEKTVPVRMPLMTLATLPRVLGPGEEVNLPVTVFAMEKRIKDFTVEVVPNEFFQLLDGKTKSAVVKQPGEFDFAFKLKVASREGVGKIKVIARSGNEKSEYDIEINVRNPNSKMVKYFESVVEGGKIANINYSLIGIAGTNKATLEVSSIPPVDLSRRLAYLLEYPYGCVEQTTSAAFPQLYLDKFIELDSYAKKRRENNINYAINRINTMVVSDGGIGYWPGSSYANEWGSCYGGHFMLEAEKLGFNLPSGFKKNWLSYQRKEARNWTLGKHVTYEYDRLDMQLTQAYRLYTLALAGEPEMGAMNRLKEMTDLTVPAAWRLAAAYALVKQQEVAKLIISKKRPENLPNTVYHWFNSTFGSEERDWAMELETLTLLGDKTNAVIYMKKVAKSLASFEWMSTQTTAYSLLGISKFLESNKTSNQIKFTYSGGGKSDVKVDTRVPVVQLKLDAKGAGEGKVTVNNTGSGMLFVRIVTEGIPETGPKEEIENNLKMTVVFKTTSGGSIDISSIPQGTDFVAHVTLWNTYRNGGLTNMALRQIFPSGWEISNTRMDKEGVAEEYNGSTNFTYQDFRDDRVLTFFDMSYQASKTFTVHLNATYVGKFYFPGTLCESMYEPGVNAFMPGKWVEVIKE
jgi:alpha-2-macroglobulin